MAPGHCGLLVRLASAFGKNRAMGRVRSPHASRQAVQGWSEGAMGDRFIACAPTLLSRGRLLL
jgi:hypothetical protein